MNTNRTDTQKHTAITTLLVAATLALPATANAVDPERAPDDTWISVSGRVVSTTPRSFFLDYGEGKIQVEMDDFDFDADGRKLLANDEVVVRGRVDDAMFEKKTIEAASVYVEDLNTYFYANPADEEDFDMWSVRTPIVVSEVELTGTVQSVVGREFTIDSGAHDIQVDTMALGYDPTDDAGYLKVETGDRVKVGGTIDNAVFDETELSANWIIELSD